MITWEDLWTWTPTLIVVLLVAAAIGIIWGLCRVWRHIDELDAELDRQRKADQRIARRRFRP